MKPYEQFVANMLRAARATQKDPMAATAIIQDALKSAGLLRTPSPEADAAAREEPDFVDVNPVPPWSRKPAAPQQEGAPQSAPQSAPMPNWAEQLKAFHPGHAKAPEQRDPRREPGQFLHGVFGAAAGSRRYRLYVPAKPTSGPRPLVVMLHGCKQDPADFAAGTTMNALAEEHGCLVLYPEQPHSANASGCWNWFEAPHQRRDQGEPAILAGMTREILREHGGDAGRVYVAGLSAGGAMAAILGATYPDLYAAVGVHSGLAAGCAHDLMSGLNAMKGAHLKKARGAHPVRALPVIVFHGDADAVVSPSNGDAVYHQFTRGVKLAEAREQGNGWTRTVARDDAGRTRAEYWRLQGAGHTWSGGSTDGSYAVAAGPNASAEMLRFFLEHER